MTIFYRLAEDGSRQVTCRACAPIGCCVCVPRAELLDAPAPESERQDDTEVWIPAPRTGA